MRRAWSLLVSMRTTAAILVALSALLLVNVLVPQAASDPERFTLLAREGRVARWLLVDAGLGRVPTSPLFLATLAVFFANLVAVLVDRVGRTIRRVRFAPPTLAQARALARAGEIVPDPDALGPAEVAAALEKVGYRTARIAPDVVWGVKHRLALLGFPLFHASFILLFAGGIQLYLTRDVVTTGGAEGQEVDFAAGTVVRRAPLGAPPPYRIAVERVDVGLDGGKPVDLAASLRRTDLRDSVQVARVNQPAAWGPVTVLVDRAGIAPVLWVQDGRGFTRDRVAVITATRRLPTRVPLVGATLEAVIEPIPVGKGFPERTALPRTPVRMRLRSGKSEVFDGSLRPGEAVRVGDLVVVLEEVRYWVGLRAVSERGGGLLIAGFLVLVGGISWRMFWYRRDVVFVWEERAVRAGGRADFNPRLFREELRKLCEVVAARGPEPGPRRNP